MKVPGVFYHPGILGWPVARHSFARGYHPCLISFLLSIGNRTFGIDPIVSS